MATKKVTVTLPEEQLERIRRLVVASKATSISAFVQHAVGLIALDRNDRQVTIRPWIRLNTAS